jgi:hypothetical protein
MQENYQINSQECFVLKMIRVTYSYLWRKIVFRLIKKIIVLIAIKNADTLKGFLHYEVF